MRRQLTVAIAVLATLLIGACGGSPASTGSTTASGNHPNLSGKTIKFIYNGTASLSTVELLHAMEILRSWGADAQITYGGSAQVVFGAMQTDQADVLEFSPQGALAGIDNGLDLKAFALDGPRMDYAFISKPSIKTIKELKGAKVGLLDTVGLNGIQVSMVLKAGGLQAGDVTLIPTGGQGARVAALLSGRIDATMVGYANWLTLQPQGYNLLYSYVKEQPKMMDGVLWAKSGWLTSHKTEAIAINQAMLESFRWFNDPKNKAAWIKLATDNIKGADPAATATMYDTYKSNDQYPVNAILDLNALSFNQDQYVLYKSLDKTLPVKQWADDSYAVQALAKEGKV
jgi:ABC-type nitrate/sulfonate/bicarbonate transport system substrate-binding protein